MIPRRIELENFLSFGRPAAEFVFSDDEPLWALCGPNGVGKSAVFDGITYALYGEHRGGSQKSEQLVRHGASGFRIVLEFEFRGLAYRITRTRSGRTSQKVERRTEAGWEAIPGINTAADVKSWVERTLGLGSRAFTSSVLLRQGEADRLFSASREERIALLKGIVGFERFEAVSGRVHAATIDLVAELDALRRQLDVLEPVEPEALQNAEEAVNAADQRRDETQARFTAAVRQVEQSRRWEALEARRIELERKRAAAEQRLGDAERIERNRARLDELAATVPLLAELVGLRDRIAELEPGLAQSCAARDRLAAELDRADRAANVARTEQALLKTRTEEAHRHATQLQAEIERGKKLSELADALDRVQARLETFPADLPDQVAEAERQESAALQAKDQASRALAGAEALLQQSKRQRQRFADLTIGATCSQCGQRVDEHHAQQERARLDREVADRQAEVDRRQAEASAAALAADAARQRRLQLQQRHEQLVKDETERSAIKTSLASLEEDAGAAAIRVRLAQLQDEKLRMEAQADEARKALLAITSELTRLGTEQERLDAARTAESERIRSREITLTSLRAAYEAGVQRLTEPWRTRLGDLDADGVRRLAAERDSLRNSGVAEKAEQLRQDREMRAEWSAQSETVSREIDTIPVDARLPAREAEHRRDQCQAALEQADRHRDETVRTRDGLKARAERYTALTVQAREVERQVDLHKKLDALLGQNGLQRELVRDAEQQILELANDTLQNLTDGILSLEPDDEATGRDDRAFALRVRKANDPLPIGVSFLSGSQKFRVAVSVALAIGRFASGRARPLEAVIIDEGFGSLDRDGLRAMAEELKRLQQTQALKRVILVSHQEEFTDQFPVGYRLTPGPAGTTATPFRR